MTRRYLQTLISDALRGVTVKDFCRFLESGRIVPGLHCAEGINFSWVGPDRAVCRACPLADLGDTPLCPNVDVYVYRTRGPQGATVVEVEYGCLSKADLSADARCRNCPDRPWPATTADEAAVQALLLP